MMVNSTFTVTPMSCLSRYCGTRSDSDTDLKIHGSTLGDEVRIENSSATVDFLTLDFDAGEGNDVLILDGNVVDITDPYSQTSTITATGTAIIATHGPVR